MDARTLEFLHANQRIIAVVNHHPELQRLTGESTAFSLYCDAVAALENWETKRAANQMEIRHRRTQTREAINHLLGDLRCVEAAATLTPPHIAPLPVLKPPSPTDHVERIIAAAEGTLMVAREYEAQLIESGMHPRKLDDVEQSKKDLADAHLQLSVAEAYAPYFSLTLDDFKRHVRDRRCQLHCELYSAMNHEVRLEWKQAASLGRKHRDHLLPSGQQPALA